MRDFGLIELLTDYSLPFIDIRLMENLIFKVFIKYIHIGIWHSEWGEGLIFMTGPGSTSPHPGLIQTIWHRLSQHFPEATKENYEKI
jgi:hypothetical protein